MKNPISFDTHETLDKNTLLYIYRNILNLLVNNKENWVEQYSNGKNDAYVEVMRIINDILDT